MFRGIVQDIIFLLVILAVAYFAYKKWLAGWLGAGAVAIKKTAESYKTDVKVIRDTSMKEIVNNLFKAATPYMSQEDARKQAAAIRAAKGF